MLCRRRRESLSAVGGPEAVGPNEVAFGDGPRGWRMGAEDMMDRVDYEAMPTTRWSQGRRDGHCDGEEERCKVKRERKEEVGQGGERWEDAVF